MFHSVCIRVLAMGCIACAVTACASERGPQVLAISHDQYEQAFDAAAEAARKEGLTPVLRDPRTGLIETQTHFAGSILEPWRLDNASIGQALENTAAFQRRRARFEFTRADALRDESSSQESAALPPVEDLTAATGPLELRVWVFVERAETPGVRRDTWTRRMTTTAVLVHPEKDTGTYWRSVERDEAYERRLLAMIEKQLR